MRVAQRLYENGYITYMRTDSHHAVGVGDRPPPAARPASCTAPSTCPTRRAHYRSKVKNAQEAHEAIRPAGDRFRTPAQVAGELRGDEFRLYELIWKRTVASQMADARGSTASVRLGATLDDGAPATTVEFSASGTVITFRGFLAAYEEGRDDDAGGARAGRRRRGAPPAQARRSASRLRRRCAPRPTATRPRPPPRYTEATLVKALEEHGIGRPSTYASIIGTIQDRGYVYKKGTALVPTWLAFAVIRLLEEHFAAAGRLRLHRRDGGRPRRDRRRRRRARGAGCTGSTSVTRRSRTRGCATSSRTSARSTPGRSRPSTSARASSCGSAATARTSRRPCRPASTRDRRVTDGADAVTPPPRAPSPTTSPPTS